MASFETTAFEGTAFDAASPSLPSEGRTMSLESKITAKIDATEGSALDLGSGSARVTLEKLLALGNGTGNGQADMIWSDTRTIAASSSENLDLAGVLVGAFGNTLTFAKIKAILVVADAGNTNDVVVGAAGSNTFVGPFADATDAIKVKPGGVFLAVAPNTGWTVTASTGDILKVANSGSGTGVTYSVILIGTSS